MADTGLAILSEVVVRVVTGHLGDAFNLEKSGLLFHVAAQKENVG